MQSRQLLHKLARYKYYDAHREVAYARQQVRQAQRQADLLNHALENLGYWSSDEGLLAARQRQHAIRDRNAARVLRLENHLIDCTKEKCKWQIMEQKLLEVTRKSKIRTIDTITEDMIQTRYR